MTSVGEKSQEKDRECLVVNKKETINKRKNALIVNWILCNKYVWYLAIRDRKIGQKCTISGKKNGTPEIRAINQRKTQNICAVLLSHNTKLVWIYDREIKQ